MCAPLPGSAFRYAGSVATSVLPSPVRISAILPLLQHHAADQLHVEMAQAERAARGLAHDRERLGQQVVEGLAGRELLAELDGLGGEIGVGQGLQGRLERVDLPDEAVVLTDESLVATAENAGEPISHWGSGR